MKLQPTDKHNRTLRAVDIPTEHVHGITEVEIYIDYTHEKNDGGMLYKALAIDEHVVPQIVKAVNMHDELVTALDEARAGLIEWMSEYGARDETDDNLLAKIDDLIQKARHA